MRVYVTFRLYMVAILATTGMIMHGHPEDCLQDYVMILVMTSMVMAGDCLQSMINYLDAKTTVYSHS